MANTRKLLPGQYTFSEAIIMVAEMCAKARKADLSWEEWEEIEKAEKLERDRRGRDRNGPKWGY